MRESFRQQFINCNLNNQFSLFFVLASKVESVQSSKLTYLKNVDFLGVEDILFANFNKLFINKPVLMQTVTYLHEAERNESRTSIKKFKNIRIKLAAMSFLNFDSNFLLHLAFIWNILSSISTSYCKVLSYCDFTETLSVNCDKMQKSCVIFWNFWNFWSLFFLSDSVYKKYMDLRSETIGGINTVRFQLNFKMRNDALLTSFCRLSEKET